MRTRAWIVLAAIALAASSAWSQSNQAPGPAQQSTDPLPPTPTGLNDALQALGRGEYLRGIDLLHSSFGTHPARGDVSLSIWEQLVPTITTLPDLKYADQGKGELSSALEQQLRAATLRGAIAEIVKRARNTRIVILNEAHNSPRDRAFALKVARALRPLGYDYLAAETFANGPIDVIAGMARDGYPRRGQGFYLMDPVFSDFVRQSLALGFRPIAYESPAPGFAREQGQADNLARIFRDNPQARVFIYVGYGHLAEQPLGAENEDLMAGRLKKATGIDPLTIDQALISEYSHIPNDRAMHSLMASRIIGSPMILMFRDGPLVVGKYAGRVDLQVVHPRTQIRQGRPTWLASLGRQPVPIPADLIPRTGRRLVQAFIASEADDAIPVDQILVHAGQPAPVLMLPRRPIRYAVQDSP